MEMLVDLQGVHPTTQTDQTVNCTTRKTRQALDLHTVGAAQHGGLHAAALATRDVHGPGAAGSSAPVELLGSPLGELEPDRAKWYYYVLVCLSKS